MLLSKFQSSIGLIFISGIVLIILTYFIINPQKKVEGFKGGYIISEDELHKQNIAAEKKRHSKVKGKVHLSTQKIKADLHNLIRNDPTLIDEVGQVISDSTISKEIDKTLKSKPVLNRVSEVISTPKITQQISDIINNNAEFKKINRAVNEIKATKKDIRRDMLKVQSDIKKEVKKDMQNAQKKMENKVKTAVTKIADQRQTDIKKDIPKETPYDRILRAHNKLSDKNNMMLEKKRKDLEEIKSIRKQIEKVGETQQLNQKEASKLEVEIEKVQKAHTRAEKDLKEQINLFKDLVKRNLATYNNLGELTANVKRSKNICDKQTSEVNRLKVRIESVESEKRSAEDNLTNLNSQLKAANANESMTKVLKGQIEQLEKQKAQIEKDQTALNEDLQTAMKKEAAMQADIQSKESNIKLLTQENLKMEKQIADATAKNKLEKDAVISLKKDIDEAKNRLAVRNSTNALLDNELRNLRKQYDVLSNKETQEEKQLKELEKDSSRNKQTINELQITMKLLQTRPKNFPIANWDFTKSSLKDMYNKFQSETVGNVPFVNFDGKTCAHFKDQNHIKITGSINTNDFKSITMMLNTRSNPGPYPRIWEFTNSPLGGSWCADSMFGVLNPANAIGFYSMKNCGGPQIWSNTGNMPKASWQHLAFVYNTSMTEMTLYVNGKKGGHWSDPTNKTFQNKTYTNMYIMQCIERFNKDAGVAWFRIFDYVLDKENIRKDMNNEWTT